METQDIQNIHIGGRKAVNPQEVAMLQADVNYTVLYFTDGNKSIVATTLKTLESRFKPFNFYRTHKSYLVNIACVKCYLKPHNQVQMSDDKKILVSRRKVDGLKKCLHIEEEATVK
jgi:DNA-binding LytR/AlgR family response regulator